MYLQTVWSIYYWFVTMGNAWSIRSSDLFPISRVQDIWGRTSLLHCKSCPKVHPLWYWCVLSLQVWWQRDTVQLWIHLFIWNWSRRMMTFSPDMGVRSGGDASAATRIASSSLDLAQADLHGTGWTKELVGLLLTWSTPKHVYTGSYGKSFKLSSESDQVGCHGTIGITKRLRLLAWWTDEVHDWRYRITYPWLWRMYVWSEDTVWWSSYSY